MNKLLLLLIPAVFIFGFCKSGKKGKPGNITADNKQKEIFGNITISGAYAITGLVGKWAEEFKKIHRDVTIGILETGTGQGIADLIDNKADLAMISRPLTEEEGVWVMPVARDGVALIVNDKNPYLSGLLKKGLSRDEIQKIFTGITPPSWGELLDTAGKDKPVVYTMADDSGAAYLETAHRSVWLGVYPENLCRELTLGSMCKPDDPAILAFLLPQK